MQDIEHMQNVRSPFLKEAIKWENSAETRQWFTSNSHLFETRELQVA